MSSEKNFKIPHTKNQQTRKIESIKYVFCTSDVVEEAKNFVLYSNISPEYA